MADGVDDIVVDALCVFRADADLYEAVEYAQRLSATVRAILDLPALRTVERRPLGMPGPLVDHGLLNGQ